MSQISMPPNSLGLSVNPRRIFNLGTLIPGGPSVSILGKSANRLYLN